MQKNRNTKILVCTHQKIELNFPPLYQPIHCGKAITNQELNIIGDNIGQNISVKNKNYCELTSIYWAWKNIYNLDYIGIAHYRRYFSKKNKNIINNGIIFKKDYNYINEDIIDLEEINSVLNNYDIILPTPKILPTTIKKDYMNSHIPEDFSILREAIIKKYPSYINSFDYVMTKTNKMSCYNMFITSKKIFDAYCSWLFDILFEVEKNIHISKYPYQARVFGFMSERLLNVYCYHNQLKIKYKPILFICSDKTYPFYIQILNNIRCKLSFLLSTKK